MISAAVVFCGCDNDDDTNASQREFIVEYLEDDHDPNLIAESEVAYSLDLDPPFYTVYPAYAYRYIATYYDAGRDALMEVTSGSRVTLTFDLFEFTGSEISSSKVPIYTNDPQYKEALVEEGLTIVEGVNDEMWAFVPMTFAIGGGALLVDIENALIGCREGDEVEIYLTYNAAYQNTIIGLIEKASALRFRCVIEGVEN